MSREVNPKVKAYWDALTPKERETLAKACKTSSGHLRNIVYGFKSCAEKLAIALERETRGGLRCEDFRDDVDWEYLRTHGASPTRATA